MQQTAGPCSLGVPRRRPSHPRPTGRPGRTERSRAGLWAVGQLLSFVVVPSRSHHESRARRAPTAVSRSLTAAAVSCDGLLCHLDLAAVREPAAVGRWNERVVRTLHAARCVRLPAPGTRDVWSDQGSVGVCTVPFFLARSLLLCIRTATKMPMTLIFLLDGYGARSTPTQAPVYCRAQRSRNDTSGVVLHQLVCMNKND